MSVTTDPSDRTMIVVGASRGLGRGIATALAERGAHVVAVARTASAVAEPSNGGGMVRAEAADATDPTVAGTLLDRYDPSLGQGYLLTSAGLQPVR